MKPVSELRECLACRCFAVRRAARLITQHFDWSLKPAGLRATQFTMLVLLALEGPLPLSRLADLLGVERTTLTRNVRLLLGRGLVGDETSADKRVRMLAITAKGLAAARAALPLWREAQRSVEAHLPPTTVRALDMTAIATAAKRASRSRRSTRSKKEE